MEEQRPANPPPALGALDVALGVLQDLDLDSVLERVLAAARELTGARYAALGVLDDSRSELARFITVGVDDATRRQIGELPRGRGVLGELIEDPQPLRLADVGSHPHSYGFPLGHPPMRTFLGVPVLVAGEPYGNLYLTEKPNCEQFTEKDERALVRLAALAGVAIDHAQRYRRVEQQRRELKRTVAALDATLQISHAIGSETDLKAILELVAKRGRALVAARALLIEHRSNGEMTIAAAAGDVPAELVGRKIDLQDSVAGAALRTGRTMRLEDESNRARFQRHGVGRLGFRASAGLVVPLIFHGDGYGALIATDRLRDGPAFTSEDQRLIEAFAVSAATAIATARSVEDQRRNQRLAAAEQERTRWARELHDETLQNLAAVRLGLVAQLQRPDRTSATTAVEDAVSELEREIGNLRSLITELRPAALDDIGAEAAIRDLAARARSRGLDVDLAIDLAYEQGREPDRHAPDVETAMYRIVQEALNNAQQHGHARRAVIEIEEDATKVRLSISDDGVGYDPTAPTTGFGVLGMRERAELIGGSLKIDSSPEQGTTVTVNFSPRRRRSRAA